MIEPAAGEKFNSLISDGKEAISQHYSHSLMKFSVSNQSHILLQTGPIFRTYPFEDSESLNLKGSNKHCNGLSLNPFLFRQIYFWCDYVNLFKIKQIGLAAGENFGNFLHFR